MQSKEIDVDFNNQFLKDIKLIKSILMKYEHAFSHKESESSPPRLKDILLAEEKEKIDELKVDLLDAWSDRERKSILNEVDYILEQAKNRYYQTLQGE
jgi:hypothetical protein